MKYSELKRQAAEAQSALKKEHDLKVETLKHGRLRRGDLQKISVRVTIDNYDLRPEAHTISAERQACERIVTVLMASGVLTRRTELKDFGAISEVTFSLLVTTDEPTPPIEWMETAR